MDAPTFFGLPLGTSSTKTSPPMLFGLIPVPPTPPSTEQATEDALKAAEDITATESKALASSPKSPKGAGRGLGELAKPPAANMRTVLLVTVPIVFLVAVVIGFMLAGEAEVLEAPVVAPKKLCLGKLCLKALKLPKKA